MTMASLSHTIEAILYLKAKPLTIAQIAEYAKCDKATAEEGLIQLMGDYSHREGALEISETENGYSLQLRQPFKPLLDELIPLDIGLGALRTLAAIAMKGPLSQTDLVDLRGSGAYGHVHDLVDQGLVRRRRQSDGRSFWLQVTEKFYQRFEIDKLPQINLPDVTNDTSEPGETSMETSANTNDDSTIETETETVPNPLSEVSVAVEPMALSET
ncbi:SMC-Scp complex subunit ScpB [Adonisia turfae]|uniref:SMC-Scp complex subunit ScpB n=1 Tax=Adonisia turfae CCMR0081 TaxID=2292702 RepID=A0A6M0RKQ7_9CYAN|nr:SMC-Scp complex subunit ScpB [Adonisia turfae CCMR0081]